MKLHINLDGAITSIHDLINNEDLKAEGDVLCFKVSAGAFRVIDIKLK